MVSHPVSSMMRYVVESLALVCVNVYIIISGYFGIRPRVGSVLNFVFMVLFWRLLINMVFLGTGLAGLTDVHLSASEFLLLCIPGYNDWFVAAYILLILFAPVLNAYVGKASLKELWTFVIAYEGVQVLFGWLLNAWGSFGHGYSLLSFVGLYLFGAAVRRSRHTILRRPFTVYFLISVAVGVLVYAANRYAPASALANSVTHRFLSYNGLFVLLASGCLFVGFKHLEIKSRAVNYVAASAFAVYLLHMHPLMSGVYAYACRYLYGHFSTWPYIALISAFIAGVFFVAVAIDLVRRRLWSRIATTTVLRRYFKY